MWTWSCSWFQLLVRLWKSEEGCSCERWANLGSGAFSQASHIRWMQGRRIMLRSGYYHHERNDQTLWNANLQVAVLLVTHSSISESRLRASASRAHEEHPVAGQQSGLVHSIGKSDFTKYSESFFTILNTAARASCIWAGDVRYPLRFLPILLDVSVSQTLAIWWSPVKQNRHSTMKSHIAPTTVYCVDSGYSNDLYDIKYRIILPVRKSASTNQNVKKW
jgi:hypothetical protein